GAELLHPAVVQRGVAALLVLGEDLGELAAGPQGSGQHSLERGILDHFVLRGRGTGLGGRCDSGRPERRSVPMCPSRPVSAPRSRSSSPTTTPPSPSAPARSRCWPPPASWR